MADSKVVTRKIENESGAFSDASKKGSIQETKLLEHVEGT